MIRILLIGLAAFCMATFTDLFTPWLQLLELKTLDALFLLRRPLPPPRDIVVVAIDEASFASVRQQWPWPRSLHALLVDRLRAKGARVIVFDLLFPDPSAPAEDAAFADAIRRAGNVVLAADLTFISEMGPGASRWRLVKPIPPLEAAAAAIGAPKFLPDADGVIRRSYPGFDDLPSLAYAGARLWLPDADRHAPPPAPPADSGALLIDFIGPPRSIQTVSYSEVIDPRSSLPGEMFRDKLVFVGRSLSASPDPQRGTSDVFPTPFASPFVFGSRTLMAGVEISANFAAALLEGRRVTTPDGAFRWLFLLVAALASAALLAPLSPTRGAWALAGLLLAVAVGGYLAFARGRLWLPLFSLMIQCAVAYVASLGAWYLHAERERRWIRTAFSRYVAPEVVGYLMAHPERLELGGRELEATIMFTDLAGFSSMSERRTPREIVGTINEYLEQFNDIIFRHRGAVDKFMGDGIMAYWGAPMETPDHALRACRAALEMREAMEDLKARWAARGYPDTGVRIGLNTGPVIAGNVGSHHRVEYTVMGDSVNIAARLEPVNKTYGTAIIISETTAASAGEAIVVRELGAITVRGREQPVTIYELIGLRDRPLSEADTALLREYAEAMRAFKAGRREEAAERLEGIMAHRSGDGPSGALLRRCREDG